jgi:hypothetical protein
LAASKGAANCKYHPYLRDTHAYVVYSHSDADLSLSKNGAVAGIVSMGNNDKEDPKERIGSWELRVKEGGRDLGDGISRQESLEEEGVTPFAKPVAPDERV